MSEGGDESTAAPVVAATPAAPAVMDVQTALKAALRSAHFADGLAKGLHEAAKALDNRYALKYQLSSKWCGLCKYDQEGKARKVVGCSCAVVRDFGNDEQAKAVLTHYFATKKSSELSVPVHLAGCHVAIASVASTDALDDSELLSPQTMLLPRTVKDPPPEQIHLVGLNITNYPKWLQFILLCLAIFIFYVGYGYMQELMFQLPGMKPFGWYLTLLQFIIYSTCGYLEGAMYHDTERKLPMRIYVILAFFTVATMGLSNASIGYLNYPTQVIFKCCKLIPVLIGGMIIQGKRYGLLDVTAAVMMSVGLIMFTLADSAVSPMFDPRGYVMICGALLADAVIGNLQEKNMKKYGGSSNEMVLYSYSIGAAYIFVLTLLSGEFFEAFAFFAEHPWKTYGYGLVFGFLGYLGVNVVLTLVKVAGALMAVTVTTFRKALTITLSFIMFAKPFTLDYLWAGTVIMVAIYLNLYSKNKKKWDPYIIAAWRKLTGKKKSEILMM
uniref:Adenosine 3'-phospho 5'-phosphosulfate transporter 2 n=1 Tax=Pristionchus pacificus TaxID=54126 RepID=A0A2A6CIJ6_PRIPA|eukprot:PDM77926.1 pst-2 [Pristionchus pacificus]